ncbi:VanW family protein [Neobacillus niacini]|uniref:VanW family protein n=1 Tax=Neobacillus niacini TaxID=86668 RepID=UPI002863F548|nr:VanW family protein [Neobacillus niacini]MDR7002141.1 vancomycin resistance protein YoaR [Neobacillus niacini]
MNINWLLGLIILSQQVNMPGSLLLTNHGQPLSYINRSDLSMNLPGLPINIEKFEKFMDEIDKNISKQPKNAMMNHQGNIIPEQVGSILDRKIFTEQVFSYYFNNGSSKLEVPIQKVYPRVDSELLGNIRSEKIGRYVTFFNHYHKERNKNIVLAAKAINNFVLFPGETFSFNKVVGKRTAGKGYMAAPVIIKGEFSEDIGGGICQVSTTLFNAVDNAGLNVLQRQSHSKEVSYVPPGRDATVSWDGPDLVFKNKYNQPILIQAKTAENKLIIEIFSSDVITYTPKKVPYLPNEQNRLPK